MADHVHRNTQSAIFWPVFCSGHRSEPASSWPGRSGDDSTQPRPPPLTTAVKLKHNCSTSAAAEALNVRDPRLRGFRHTKVREVKSRAFQLPVCGSTPERENVPA